MSVVENTKEQLLSSRSWSVAVDEPSISGSIRVGSLETLHEQRDAPLRSPDAERYPEIGFHAQGMRFNGDDSHFARAGELTIKGISRPIILDGGELYGSVIDAEGRERIALARRGQLDRSDYGLVWNRVLETGNVVVGETVDLSLDIAAVRAA